MAERQAMRLANALGEADALPLGAQATGERFGGIRSLRLPVLLEG